LSREESQEEVKEQISPEVERAWRLYGPTTLDVTTKGRTVKFRILEAYRYRRYRGRQGVMIACKIENSPTFHLWWDRMEDPKPKILEAVKLWLKTRK